MKGNTAGDIESTNGHSDRLGGLKLDIAPSPPAKPAHPYYPSYPSVGIDFLTHVPYDISVKATLTSKGQITIPAPIRVRLGLKPGQVLDFDDNAPFLKAVPVFDEDEMSSVLGCARGVLGRSSAEWLSETRGSVEIPPETE